jgi:membrane protease YdiL (CAAX protease family)
MFAFLFPVVVAAVVLLVRHDSGVTNASSLPTILSNPTANLVVGLFDYLPLASTVPLALYLLARTGQSNSSIGLGTDGLKKDLAPGLGLTGALFGAQIALLIPVVAFLNGRSSEAIKAPIGHSSASAYYLIWGVTTAAVAAIAEEILVNGYLTTRLGQLGWTPRRTLVLSLVLRSSYHIYYGIGFLVTIPAGLLLTRSFQKHHRLNRPVIAHFLFDSAIFAIGVIN